MIVNCKQCKKDFNGKPAAKRSYCSTVCYIQSQKVNKLGMSNPNWRGGLPDCNECGEKTRHPTRDAKLCGKCYTKSLSTRSPEMHPNWKGGISKQSGYDTFLSLRYRYKKRANGGTHTFTQWNNLKELFNSMCLCCKQREPLVKLTEDHIVPISMGGTDDISNIQPLCKSCNSKKYTKNIDYRLTFAKI